MKSRAIPDEAITSSSFMLPTYLPANARLDRNIEWTAAYQNIDQWLQVDLITVTKVTQIATQGSQNNNEWVASYSLQYSVNATSFADYDGVFVGNTDDTSIVKRDISPAIIVRYIRVRPKTWINRISLRMELYGCK
jgi:hypothetical protein